MRQKKAMNGCHLVPRRSEAEQVAPVSSSYPRACSGDMCATVPSAAPELVRIASIVAVGAFESLASSPRAARPDQLRQSNTNRTSLQHLSFHTAASS